VRAARYLVSVDTSVSGAGGLSVGLLDVQTGRELMRRPIGYQGWGSRSWRFSVHRAADDVVRAVTGAAGIAATSLLYVRAGRLWRVDADGSGETQLRTAGNPTLSPAWSPDARRIAYTAFVANGQPLVVQDLGTEERRVVPGTEFGINITPEFSPDGRRLAWAHGNESGTAIRVYEPGGETVRLTAGRFADDLSPTWSPDGSRLAFISNRAGTPQLYVMAADGSGQEVLGRFDYGVTGATNAPAWSPDGQSVAFHREVNGTPQVFVLDVATRAVTQVTGQARNEDPTWAPDGRHLAFVSDRSGARELWVVDLDTGRLRQLTAGGGARLPAWSPRLSGTEER
jgi:TolB protein